MIPTTKGFATSRSLGSLWKSCKGTKLYIGEKTLNFRNKRLESKRKNCLLLHYYLDL